jgi:hypothetical protein
MMAFLESVPSTETSSPADEERQKENRDRRANAIFMAARRPRKEIPKSGARQQ